MTVYFTADLHLGHAMVAGLRGFTTSEAHDATVASNWLKTVRKEDTVWVLGDVALGGLTRALDLVASLPGRKHLITGNHDKCHPMHRDSYRWQPEYLRAAFDSVQAFALRKIDGQKVLLSHFPYTADHTEDVRYTEWRLPDTGLPLLHGHTHSRERGTPHEVHVGLDAWDLHPVSLEVISSVLQERGV